MMERRLLVGMAGIVAAVLCALAAQVVADVPQPVTARVYGNRG